MILKFGVVSFLALLILPGSKIQFQKNLKIQFFSTFDELLYLNQSFKDTEESKIQYLESQFVNLKRLQKDDIYESSLLIQALNRTTGFLYENVDKYPLMINTVIMLVSDQLQEIVQNSQDMLLNTDFIESILNLYDLLSLNMEQSFQASLKQLDSEKKVITPQKYAYFHEVFEGINFIQRVLLKYSNKELKKDIYASTYRILCADPNDQFFIREKWSEFELIFYDLSENNIELNKISLKCLEELSKNDKIQEQIINQKLLSNIIKHVGIRFQNEWSCEYNSALQQVVKNCLKNDQLTNDIKKTINKEQPYYNEKQALKEGYKKLSNKETQKLIKQFIC